MNGEAVRRSLAKIEADIREHLVAEFTEAFSIDRYVSAAAQRDLYSYCEIIPEKQERFARSVAQRFPQQLGKLNKIALAILLRNRLSDERLSRMPESLRRALLKWSNRIAEDIERNPDSYYDLWSEIELQRSDLLKDFAVASGRALPVAGAWIVQRQRLREADLLNRSAADGDSADDVSILGSFAIQLKSRLRDGLFWPQLRKLRRYSRELRGEFAEYYVIHTSNRNRRHFSRKYLLQAYEDVAELLAVYPDVKGIYRRSWFLDPRLKEIDQATDFLRDTPAENGALFGEIMPVPSSERRRVLEYSKARKSAFESGAYQPTVWAYLWKRDDVLNWAFARREANASDRL